MEGDDPVWAGLPPCAPRADARRWHALAGVFLLLALLRLPVLEWVPALALGACLWWVAQRQAGAQAAALAILFLLGSPMVFDAGREVWAALGLFAVMYTALGVAHALQGPRRKWLPRIVLMTAATVLLALASRQACAVGLPVALAAALYLGRQRWRVLLLLAGGWLLLAAMLPRVPGDGTSAEIPRAVGYVCLLAVLVCTVGLWAVHRRSRWFGNTLPLGMALIFAGSAREVGPAGIVWCLPFALLFIAGVTSDSFQRGVKHRWAAVFWTLAVFQFIFSFV